jgi:hypothetical protein
VEATYERELKQGHHLLVVETIPPPVTLVDNKRDNKLSLQAGGGD